MSSERDREEEVREFRLEGLGLFVIGGVLVAALVGSFFGGRWYERSVSPVSRLGLSGDDPLAHVAQTEQPAEVDETANFFDTMQGGEKEAEPGRQVAVEGAQAQAPTPPPAASTPASAGPNFVQVFAGRDRKAAESLFDQLKAAGYPARVFSERDGPGGLFKVRVGGYATEEEARSAAAKLQKEGFAGAWVTRIED